MRFNFCGPTYSSRSITADGERCVNLYPEIIESGAGKSRMALYATPGLELFSTLPTGPIRGMLSGNGLRPDLLLVVAGSKLYSLYPYLTGGSYTLIGDVGNDGRPVMMAGPSAAVARQFLILSGQHLYVYDGTTLTDAAIPIPFWGITYMDGYAIATDAGKNVYVSKLYDASTWDALDFGVNEVAGNQINGVFADHGELFVFGSMLTEVWYNSGNSDFPFQRNPNGIIEQGLAAKFSIAKCDNSVFWLGSDSRGWGVVWRANGLSPVRVSNHAVEYAIQSYTRIEDAEAYSYEDHGHSFYVLHFPNANATWCYDAATNMWHERGAWNGTTYGAHPARYHAAGCGSANLNGAHFVGDYRNGRIYRQDISYLTDAGVRIRRMRRSPHIADEAKRIRYNSLAVDMQPGMAATVNMKFSNDGGFTWSHTYSDNLSAADTRARVKWNRLGAGRDRVFEVWTDDPSPIAFVDAYVDAGRGNGS